MELENDDATLTLHMAYSSCTHGDLTHWLYKLSELIYNQYHIGPKMAPDSILSQGNLIAT